MDGDRDSAEAVLPAQESGRQAAGPPAGEAGPGGGTAVTVAPPPDREQSPHPGSGPDAHAGGPRGSAERLVGRLAWRGKRGGSAGRVKRDRPAGRVDPWLLAGGFLVLYTALSLARYRRMETMSWDLGIFEQAVRGYAHLHAPVADLKGPGFNILGDHFSPITALIAPFYRIFPTPVTLLVAQALLFAVSVVPVTRAAGRVLGRSRGSAVGVAYGLSWGVQRAVDFDFHEIAFAVPLLAFSLEAVLRRRWSAAIWWAAPLVLVKEDMGASVALIGAVVWLRAGQDTLRRRGGRSGANAGSGNGNGSGGMYVRTWAVGLAAFGVLMSGWEINWLIPAFHGPGYDALNHLDGDGSLTGHIPKVTALRTALWILVPAGGVLALRSPLLLVALPTVGWRFMSHYPENWGTAWHYSAVLMPVVFLAMVDAARLVGGAAPGKRWAPSWLRSLMRGLPAAMAGAAVALSTQLPLAELSHRSTYQVDARTRAAERALRQVPDGATVEANVGPVSRLVRRTTVYWVGQTKGVVPGYMAFENESGWLRDPVGYARQLHPRARYTEVADAGGYVVLRRE